MRIVPFYTIVMWGLLVCFAVVLAVTPLSCADIWWHLKTGEIILQTHRIPHSDFFSFTSAGNKWISHEWLSEVFFSLIEHTFGLNGLIVFKALLLFFVCLCLYRIIRGKSVDSFVAILGIIGFLYLSRHRFFVRPHIYSFFFFSLLILWVEKFQHATRNRFWFGSIPLLMMVWANMHGGVLFGLLYLSCYCVPQIVLFRGTCFWTQKKTIVSLILIFSCLACFINPHGVDIFVYPFTLIREGYIAENREWFSPFDSRMNGYYLRIYFICFSVSVLLSYVLAWKKPPLFEFAVIVLFFLLGIKSQRNIPFWGMVALPYCLLNFTLFYQRIRNIYISYLKPVCVLGLVILIFFSIKQGTPIATQGRGASRIGFGINKSVMPVDAIAFLHAYTITGNVFNSYEYGGFVIYTSYPDLKVFIDGRADVYGGELYELFRRALSVPHYFELLEKKYPFDIILLPYEKEHSALHCYLHNSPLWKLAYFDDVALIYLKNTEKYAPLIKQVGFEYINPVIFDKSNKEIMEKTELYCGEYVKQLQRSPHVQITYVHLGILYQLNEKYDLAEKIFLQGIAVFGETYVFNTQLGILYRQTARLQQAEMYFKKAVSLNSYMIDAMGNLALVYYEQNKIDSAEKLLKKILVKHPNDETARAMLRIIKDSKSN